MDEPSLFTIHYLQDRYYCIFTPLCSVVEINKQTKNTTKELSIQQKVQLEAKFYILKYGISPAQFDTNLKFWVKKNKLRKNKYNVYKVRQIPSGLSEIEIKVCRIHPQNSSKDITKNILRSSSSICQGSHILPYQATHPNYFWLQTLQFPYLIPKLSDSSSCVLSRDSESSDNPFWN